MSALLEKIRSRGYWKVVIRPITFMEKRVHEKSTLGHIVKSRSVSIKGWDFPHVDDFREFDTGADWIGHEIRWDHILEFWRFYQSGQFVHYLGMVEDWRDDSVQPCSSGESRKKIELCVDSILTRFTEVFEFASRLSFTEVGDMGTHLEIALVNINNHVLTVPDSPGYVQLLKTNTPEFTYRADLTSIELATDERDLALKAATQLFQCFEWNPSIGLLRDIQARILSREQTVGPFVIR